MASSNTRELGGAPGAPDAAPARWSRYAHGARALRGRGVQMGARRCSRRTPTSEAEMSLADYEDFYFGACFADEPDPVEAWKRQSEEVERLRDWIQDREEVRIEGPGTDLRVGIAGRDVHRRGRQAQHARRRVLHRTARGHGRRRDHIHLPATYSGREVSGVRFRFEGGRSSTRAPSAEEFLNQTLDTDDGARRLGELGIGTNYGITDATREILLDEKIGGTVHLAVGRSYPETGGVNERGPLGHDLRPAARRADHGRRRDAARGRPLRGLDHRRVRLRTFRLIPHRNFGAVGRL